MWEKSEIDYVVNQTIENQLGKRKVKNVYRFWSGAKSEPSKLSNLSKCERFEYPKNSGNYYISSEAAFQQYFFEEKDRERFKEDGDIGGSLALLDILKVKKENWEKKDSNRPEMTGVVSKMSKKLVNAKKLGLTLITNKQKKSLEEIVRLFLEILWCKYSVNIEARNILMNTETKYLVEFGRGDKYAYSSNRKKPLWSALDDKDGTLYGGNLQGEIHMLVRKNLIKNYSYNQL